MACSLNSYLSSFNLAKALFYVNDILLKFLKKMSVLWRHQNVSWNATEFQKLIKMVYTSKYKSLFIF